MKATIVLLLVLSMGLLAVLVWQNSAIDDEMARWVPLQHLPTGLGKEVPEHCQVDALRQAIGDALAAMDVNTGRIDALSQLPRRKLRRLARGVLDCQPWSLAPDQVQSSAAVFNAWLGRERFAALRPSARHACQVLRWQSAGIELVTDSCDRVLSGLPGRWAASQASQFDGLRLRTSNPGVLEANRRFLIRPYDPKRMVELALRLHRAGYEDAAARIQQELVQISPDSAATLENAIKLKTKVPAAGTSEPSDRPISRMTALSSNRF